MSDAPISDPFLDDQDYATIEAAVLQTARGRWFLAEYARRNKAADTDKILQAVERLSSLLQASSQAHTTEILHSLHDDKFPQTAQAEVSASAGERPAFDFPGLGGKPAALRKGKSRGEPSLSQDVAARLGLIKPVGDISEDKVLPAALRSPFTLPLRPKQPLREEEAPQTLDKGELLAEIEALTFEEKTALFS